MKYLYAADEFAETFDLADSIEEAVAEARSNSWGSVYVYTSKPADFWTFNSEDYFDEERNFPSEDMRSPMEECWTNYWNVQDQALAELDMAISATIQEWAKRHKLAHFYYADQLVHSEVFEVTT
jgi:hypothetical protein